MKSDRQLTLVICGSAIFYRLQRRIDFIVPLWISFHFWQFLEILDLVHIFGVPVLSYTLKDFS